MNEMNGSGNSSGKNVPSWNAQESSLNGQEQMQNLVPQSSQGPSNQPLHESSPKALSGMDLMPAENSLPTGSPPLNEHSLNSKDLPLNKPMQSVQNESGRFLNMNRNAPLPSRQEPSQLETNSNESEEKRRKDALDLWRSLKNVNASLPEDLIADELTAASDATDLQTKSLGDCWRRSRCPMPRLRISDGVSERLIPWYSVLEVRVDSTFRLFELYLAGDVVCRIISRRPQEELYANLQLERVKVIYPVASVSVSFEDLKEKKPDPVSCGTGGLER